MFRFQDLEWLGALLLIPVLAGLFVGSARARTRALGAIGDIALVRKLAGSVSLKSRQVKIALLLTGLAFAILALGRPQFGSRVETVRARGQDIVVALDLSASMFAEDVSPSRLERARLAVMRLIERLDGDRIGLVAFAADAFVQAPLTTDYAAARMFLAAMQPSLMPIQGTDLGAALETSIEAVTQGGGDAPIVVLITDAEDHEGQLDASVQAVRDRGIQLFVVAIGSNEGVPIPVFDDNGLRNGFLRDEDGSIVTTRLGEETLQRLAQQAGAEVVLAGTDGRSLNDLFDRIAGGEGTDIDERQVTLFEEQYQLFLAMGLLLLFMEWMISDRRRTQAAWEGRFE